MAQSTRRSLSVAVVGAGNLGGALAIALPAAGFSVTALVTRAPKPGPSRARSLARKLKAKIVALGDPFDADLVWIAVPDDAIAQTAVRLARSQEWRERFVFHSSGALTSEKLASLRDRGARVASVHPLMTFVRSALPEMAGVPFTAEGDPAAVRLARAIIERLGGEFFPLRRENKALYHAFGSFTSPLLIALLVSAEQVGLAAGIAAKDLKPLMVPILWQTLYNYLKKDAASAFSGPLIRGDVETVRKHLRELRRLPEVRQVYKALATAALRYLPSKNRRKLLQELHA